MNVSLTTDDQIEIDVHEAAAAVARILTLRPARAAS